MTPPVSNYSKPWTKEEIEQLRQLAQANTPTRLMALKLGRTPQAVQSKASALRISLKPGNRTPYDGHGS